MMMKKNKFILGALAIAAATTAGLVACNKNIHEKGPDHALTAGITAVCDCTAHSGDSTINTDITSSLHLGATKTYKLSGLIFVTGNSTVTIDAGARIEGIKSGSTTVAGGGLVVTRGSKLVAVGTASCPIIFTSNQLSPVSGDWSGIIFLGKAQTNNPGANVEGISTTAYPGRDVAYGSADSIEVGTGTNLNNDNSGALKYVRIEYAGYALSTNNEINGLTLAGVGRGTTIDFVEVYKSNDDSFEFFGGTVNASHIISVDALDDMFDTDNGYIGNISFALGLADTSRKDQSQSNGFENDNNATGDTIPATAPRTHPHYSNVTIVGVDSVRASSTGTNAGGLTTRYGRAGHMRRNSRFYINSAIVFGYNYGISIDSQFLSSTSNSYKQYALGNSTLTNVFSGAYGTAATGGSVGPWSAEKNGTAQNGANFFGAYAVVAGNTGTRSSSANPFNLGNPYSRPGIGGAITNFVPNIGQASRGFGAFPNGTNWTAPTDGCTNNNWTRFHD
jgi:hypothetical protein